MGKHTTSEIDLEERMETVYTSVVTIEEGG